MKEHEHATKNKPESKPTRYAVAKKAYALYEKEGRPQSHNKQNWLEAEAQMSGHGADQHQDRTDHHAHKAADFRKRFWISLILMLPILVLSPQLQKLVGLQEAIRFPGDLYVLFGFSSAVFGYGGWPFLKGLFSEIKSRQPGMMTLVAVAITTAYLSSCAVVFGLAGKLFFWELATLVDIMLLGHWIEIRSVIGASRAVEELAKLIPSDAHKLIPDGSVKDVPLVMAVSTALAASNGLLIRNRGAFESARKLQTVIFYKNAIACRCSSRARVNGSPCPRRESNSLPEYLKSPKEKRNRNYNHNDLERNIL